MKPSAEDVFILPCDGVAHVHRKGGREFLGDASLCTLCDTPRSALNERVASICRDRIRTHNASRAPRRPEGEKEGK